MSSGRVCGAFRRGGLLEQCQDHVSLWNFRLFSNATDTCLSRSAQTTNVR